MTAISPWMPVLKDVIEKKALLQGEFKGHIFSVHLTNDSLWVNVQCSGGCCVLLRGAYSPTGCLEIISFSVNENGIDIQIKSSFGVFIVGVHIIRQERFIIRCTTSIIPSKLLIIPFWPRDLVITNQKPPATQQGEVHITQCGARSGLQYITLNKPAAGSMLYFQNLTALNEYCQATKTSLADSVGGTWPEIGFALPSSNKIPLSKNKKITISDAFLAFDNVQNKNVFEDAKQFLELLGDVYQYLPKPQTSYHKWPEILDKGLHDLQFNHACWSHTDGNDYLNAYTADYNTPPEIMVKLAVLLPLLDYKAWSKIHLPAVDKIKAGLQSFYDADLGTIVRWLPAQAQNLDGSEEQLNSDVMDSWYLHHPLLNLGRIALQGDKSVKKLFLDSLPFAIKVAHHFKYQWPVFYNFKTLEIIKAETKPGEGGEQDVAGLYAHVMLKAWQLTKQKKYLTEAKKAAKTLANKKFKLFYQANNTAFAANAMLELFIETKEELYLNIAYLCLANIFKNVQLWECNYGYAKDYSTFFGVFPLNDAPYTAAYEEQEVFAAIHQFLSDSEKITLMPSVSLLLAEFIRYLVYRAYYYYPGNLPAKMLSQKVKMGEVDSRLWIALEDIHDGWEQSGTVGQEVYGAGVAFGIVPRHYFNIPGEEFLIFVDYPSSDFVAKKGSISFHVKGHERLICRLVIVRKNNCLLPPFVVTATINKLTKTVDGKKIKDEHMEYNIYGNRDIKISWTVK